MMVYKTYLKEACVDGVQQALVAQDKGADRIELCAHLDFDGLTPDPKTIEETYRKLTIPIRVMIRPRASDFFYSDFDLQAMKDGIRLCKEVGVEGVVFGVADRKGELDLKAINDLALLAAPLKVTVHKAIDGVNNLSQSIQDLIDMGGIDAVLTSGGGQTWKEGASQIRKAVAIAGNEMNIIACGKVTNQNLNEVHKEIKASAYHGKLIVGALQ